MALVIALSGCSTTPVQQVETLEADEVEQEVDRSVPESGPQPVVSDALLLDNEALQELDPYQHFLLGVEKAHLDGFPNLRFNRVGLLTDNAALNTRGKHTIELLEEAKRVTLSHIVLVNAHPDRELPYMEEVLAGIDENRVFEVSTESDLDQLDFLKTIDILAIDLNLNGSRSGLEFKALVETIAWAALHNKQVVVFDRPLLAMSSTTIGAPASASDALYSGIISFPAMTPAEVSSYLKKVQGLQYYQVVYPVNKWSRSDAINWRTYRSDDQLTEAQRTRLQMLEDSAFGHEEAAQLLSIAELLPADHFSSRLQVGGGVALDLTPKIIPAVSAAERISALDLKGLDVQVSISQNNEEQNWLILRRIESPLFDPFLAALKILLSGVPDISDPELTETLYEIYGEDIVKLLQSGMTPEQIERRLRTNTSFTRFLEDRQRVLLYE